MKLSLLQAPSLRSICLPCRQRIARMHVSYSFQASPKRLLTTTSKDFADAKSGDYGQDNLLDGLMNVQRALPARFQAAANNKGSLSDGQRNPSLLRPPVIRPHHLHIYATRHNCHITLTAGNRNPIISLSAGNIGFKKAQRGSYDAAYQLGIYVMGLINNKAMLDERYQGNGGSIQQLEIVWRDFGPGREALSKILLGAEGRALRSRIVAVMDGTRLKFGGTRSPKPRRLG